MSVPIAIVGVGKIARDQHMPTIASHDGFALAGAVSTHTDDLDVPVAATLAELKARVPDLAAAAICTPPRGRAALIAEALDLGLHVLVEKPPAATLSEARGFAALATAAARSLFLTWHSREAPAVEPLRTWMAGRRIVGIRVEWREDVRVWHPGQEWIWEPGIGVLDPGINALSILTRIVAAPLRVEAATLDFPADRAAPIAAALRLESDAVAESVAVDFDFDQRGPQTWRMTVTSEEGEAVLDDGGARLAIDGVRVALNGRGEYARLYDRFAALIAAGAIEADLSPFELVADSFLLARRRQVAAFSWNG